MFSSLYADYCKSGHLYYDIATSGDRIAGWAGGLVNLAGQETDGYSATTVQVQIEDSIGAQFRSCSTHIPLATDIDPVHPTAEQSKKRH